MSGILAFLFPSPFVQAITAGVAGLATYAVPKLVKKAAGWSVSKLNQIK